MAATISRDTIPSSRHRGSTTIPPPPPPPSRRPAAGEGCCAEWMHRPDSCPSVTPPHRHRVRMARHVGRALLAVDLLGSRCRRRQTAFGQQIRVGTGWLVDPPAQRRTAAIGQQPSDSSHRTAAMDSSHRTAAIGQQPSDSSYGQQPSDSSYGQQIRTADPLRHQPRDNIFRPWCAHRPNRHARTHPSRTRTRARRP